MAGLWIWSSACCQFNRVRQFSIVSAMVKNTLIQVCLSCLLFNSSQLYKGMSLNNCLAKGPDCYSNCILGLLLRWRENAIAVVADIKKMYHSIAIYTIFYTIFV